MQLGMIGLGRMGASMVRRLMKDGHECLVFDMQAAAVEALKKDGAIGSASLAEMAAKMTRPRAIWLMVPAAVVDQELEQLVAHLDPNRPSQSHPIELPQERNQDSCPALRLSLLLATSAHQVLGRCLPDAPVKVVVSSAEPISLPTPRRSATARPTALLLSPKSMRSGSAMRRTSLQ